MLVMHAGNLGKGVMLVIQVSWLRQVNGSNTGKLGKGDNGAMEVIQVSW